VCVSVFIQVAGVDSGSVVTLPVSLKGSDVMADPNVKIALTRWDVKVRFNLGVKRSRSNVNVNGMFFFD